MAKKTFMNGKILYRKKLAQKGKNQFSFTVVE